MNMRAAQINGCGRPASTATGWRCCPPRERAALAWNEAVTTLEYREVPDDVFAQARAECSEQELADLRLAVIAVNDANRLTIAFHTPPVPLTIDANERVAAD
jgi:alkylhydroperoxidase family enzyme